MTNVFEEMEAESNAPQIDTVTKSEEKATKKELSVEELQGDGANYIKLPQVGETLTFTVAKIETNETVTGTNKTTGEQFGIGVKRKDGTYVRRDITTDKNEILTINSWELFYKLFQRGTDFMNLASKRNSYKGLKVSITRNFNGSYANKQEKEIALLQEWKLPNGQPDLEKAKVYKTEVAKAMKEQRLFTVVVTE